MAMLFGSSWRRNDPLGAPCLIAQRACPMSLTATILLSALPQVFQGGDLKLPPTKPAVEAAPEVDTLSDLERFQRDLQDMSGTAVRVERKLEEIGRSYQNIEGLILQVARTARSTEMKHLMPVARRYGRTSGTDRVADELLFQLLARPLGPATRPVVETMAVLKGADGKTALKQLIRGRVAAVRRHAVEVLAPLCTAEEDLQFALGLSREQSLDLQLRGVELLRAIGNEAACDRLVELLSKDPALAQASCMALIRLGDAAVPTLQEYAALPPVDRSFAYSVFALAEIGFASGRQLVPGELREALLRQLDQPEALNRVLVAVPLADLVYRADPGDAAGAAWAELDVQLVEALLLVVESRQFVPNLDMLRNPAEQRLLRHTGRVLAQSPDLSWRDWWQARRGSFLGVRARVAINADNAGSAIVLLRLPGRQVRLIGEQVADVDVRAVPAGVELIEIVLQKERMLAIVESFEQYGYGDPRRMHVEGALPRVRSLELRLADGRSSTAVTEKAHPAFDRMVDLVTDTISDQLWQLFQKAGNGPERAANWRAEREWRDAHTDPTERARRFVDHFVAGWQQWGPSLRARAIAFLADRDDRKQLLTEQQGAAIVQALKGRLQLDEHDRSLLEFAAGVPGDGVWRDCIELAVAIEDPTREVVRGIFRVLGPDAVLSALRDERAVVRRAAIDEATSSRDLRAAPLLIEMLADEDVEVRLSAAYACGQLRIEASSNRLVECIAEPETDPVMRRTCLQALGRVGGRMAFPVLERAMTSPAIEDKIAALHGLGELEDPRAAHLLVEYTVIGHGKQVGELAKFRLQRQGRSRAVPALQRKIPLTTDQDIHAELVLLLGLYQEPGNVPSLMDLLRVEKHAGRAAQRIEEATGIDLANVPDRIEASERWWQEHKEQPQWRWLLQQLDALKVPHDLRPEHFDGDARAALPELCRLMVDVRTPRLWALSAAVLRSYVDQDYGIVTQQTPADQREGFAARYRMLLEGTPAGVGGGERDDGGR